MKNDWIGTYTQGTTPRNAKCPTWLYCNQANGTMTLNVNGTRNWTSPLPEGVYFLGYFANDGYTEPFPRQQYVIGQPVKLYTELQKYSTADEVLVRYEGAPAGLPCHLCFQKDGDTQWHEVQALSQTDETLSLGRLEAGTWRYSVCIGGIPISRLCTFTVQTGGNAVGHIPSSRRQAEIFRLDGRREERSLSQLPGGIYIQGGRKILR